MSKARIKERTFIMSAIPGQMLFDWGKVTLAGNNVYGLFVLDEDDRIWFGLAYSDTDEHASAAVAAFYLQSGLPIALHTMSTDVSGGMEFSPMVIYCKDERHDTFREAFHAQGLKAIAEWAAEDDENRSRWEWHPE